MGIWQPGTQPNAIGDLQVKKRFDSKLKGAPDPERICSLEGIGLSHMGRHMRIKTLVSEENGGVREKKGPFLQGIGRMRGGNLDEEQGINIQKI